MCIVCSDHFSDLTCRYHSFTTFSFLHPFTSLQIFFFLFLSSLSAIAKKRPAFYGRILPVLLGLDPSSFFNKGFRVSGAHHALKKAFICCLNCTHPGAAPVWIFPSIYWK